MAPTKARLIGSLLFCPTCSTLLDLPGDADVIVCEQCGHEEPAECESCFHAGRTRHAPLSQNGCPGSLLDGREGM